MKEFFVIGDQTSKSLSPLIFNHWFKKYKLKAKYSYVEVSQEKFDATLVKKLQEKNTKGFNVTIPYKKIIFKHLDNKNLHAKNIGAANCVTVDKKIKGINTDWLGYLSSIKDVKINKNKKILILGYGGAAQAIFYGFSIKGYKNILVFNRSKKAIKIKGIKKFTKKYSLIEKHLEDSYLIINTTPTNPLNKKQEKTIQTPKYYQNHGAKTNESMLFNFWDLGIVSKVMYCHVRRSLTFQTLRSSFRPSRMRRSNLALTLCFPMANRKCCRGIWTKIYTG